jgi:hypothetical protein
MIMSTVATVARALFMMPATRALSRSNTLFILISDGRVPSAGR